MTAQIKDILNYDSKKYFLASEPLQPFLAQHNNITFYGYSTACIRGYLAIWEIRDKKLFLVGLHAKIIKENKKIKVGVDYLFPGKSEIFACWFNGVVRIPTGKLLKYIHLGYQSIFEKDLFLNFKDGILLGETIKENQLDSK